MIKLKRIYDEPHESDGFRILVDRLWPRGLSKDKAKVDIWMKDIAPGDSLRKWFSHDTGKWAQFKARYFEEMKDKRELVNLIKEKEKKGIVTLLFGAKDEIHNNAVALKEYIEAI